MRRICGAHCCSVMGGAMAKLMARRAEMSRDLISAIAIQALATSHANGLWHDATADATADDSRLSMTSLSLVNCGTATANGAVIMQRGGMAMW